MTLSSRAQRLLIAVFCALLAIVYAIAYLAPAVGAYYDDARHLLALQAFTRNTLLLRALPLACTVAWLACTHRLLRRMGATTNGALTIVTITAASPLVLSLGASMMPEPLLGLLISATLLALLSDRAVLAALFAAHAAITAPFGVSLIAAILFVLTARRLFGQALRFTAAAMLVAGPYLGWSLAHQPRQTLPLSDNLVVAGSNLLWLAEAPFAALSGRESLYPALATTVLIALALLKRRQLLPDLFIALYCLMLLPRVTPPLTAIAPILPLLLWILWRAFHNVRIQEAFAAAVLILAILPLAVDLTRLPPTLRLGQFPVSAQTPNDWRRMTTLFTWLRANTPPDAVLLADSDALFELRTGRRTIRGFTPDRFRIFYGPPRPVVTPDALANAILTNSVDYVALAPDRDLPESPAFHKAVEALARGGLLEPLDVPGLTSDYRLLRTVSSRFLK